MNALLGALRNRKTNTADFRAASEKLCTSLMRKTKALLVKRGAATERIVIVVILRSGVALLPAALHTFPGAQTGVLGMKRDEHTFAPKWYYENLPPLSKRTTIILLDPMLATGGTAEAAVIHLIEQGAVAKHIYFTGIVAAPEGFERLAKLIPQEHILLAAVDKKLDAHKLIVPGLGDFGDRYFGFRRP